MIITLKGANFSTNNINDLLNSYSISYTGSGVIGTPSSRPKDAVGDLTCALTILDGYTYKSLTVSIGGAIVDATQYDITERGSTVRVVIAESVITGNIMINVITEGGSIEPEPETTYTITYKYMSDTIEIKTATTETVTGGSSKTFAISNAPAIEGYTVSSVVPDGEQDINGNLTVTYYYTANSGGEETAEWELYSKDNHSTMTVDDNGIPTVTATDILKATVLIKNTDRNFSFTAPVGSAADGSKMVVFGRYDNEVIAFRPRGGTTGTSLQRYDYTTFSGGALTTNSSAVDTFAAGDTLKVVWDGNVAKLYVNDTLQSSFDCSAYVSKETWQKCAGFIYTNFSNASKTFTLSNFTLE